MKKKKRYVVFFLLSMALLIYAISMPSDDEKAAMQEASSSAAELSEPNEESKPEPKKVKTPDLTITIPKASMEDYGELASIKFTSTVENHTNEFIESAIVKFYILDKNKNVLRTTNSYVNDIPANGKRTATGECFDLDNLPKKGLLVSAEVEKFGW